MEITRSQKKALERLSFYKWLSAYESRIAMDTLQTLVDKGLVERQFGLGAVSFPLSGIKFKKKQVDIKLTEEKQEKLKRVLKRRKVRKLKRRNK